MPNVSVHDYENALAATYGRSAEDIRRDSIEFEKRFSGSEDDELRQMLRKKSAEDEANALLAELLETIHEPIRRFEDLARAKLFIELSNGALPAKAFEPLLDEEQEVQFVRLVDVPASAWRLAKIDWDRSGLDFQGKEFFGAQISTAMLLEIFPEPMFQGLPVTGTRFGDTLLPAEKIPSEGVVSTRRKSRGRPKAGDGLLHVAVRNEYKRREAAGLLSDKKEANLQSTIDWVAETFEEKVSRSSVQRWTVGSTSAQNSAQKNGP
ncbi:hypothetical protein [Citreimonas salinaria]|uniref:hypothetical protein n=1 Tax=Citreimonas salinaria TaxID=321339 RepID=UPI00115FBD82|nr:hypothetical protein [Citreimonas salinaria]